MNSLLRRTLAARHLLLDGAMGTMLQQSAPGCCGNNDHLTLTHPDIIGQVHRAYLDAGADIITTCTFNAQRISQAEYGLEQQAAAMALAGAQLARRVADSYSTPQRPRFVAGSVGPTSRLLSVDDTLTFDILADAYREQMQALVDGGVDALLIETALDLLNIKAALYAAMEVTEAAPRPVELMLSLTVTDATGNILSGHTLEQVVEAVSHAPLLSIGLNCSQGAAGLLEPLRRLSAVATTYVSIHPNAGLPNAEGGYDETPDTMAVTIDAMLRQGLVDIVGGCCGTTPRHIAALRTLFDSNKYPRRTPATAAPKPPFINVGERCNVAGSRKFLRLISAGEYEEALEIARRQVADGAMVIDVNMDDAMLDSSAAMCRFLRMLAADSVTAPVPVMIDSSDYDTLVAALKVLPGKGYVNSLSLKDGEEPFLERAREVRRLGARLVVMAFDEEGQAVTLEHRIRCCSRAYRLLTERVGYPAADLVFDPNILTVATGIDAHLEYARAFVDAAAWIRANLPGAGVSGGLSNLSFAFRGNNYVREAMHSVFLRHAVARGMNMAILNPATQLAYDEIPAPLRQAIEAVLFTECTPQAVEQLTQCAAAYMANKEAINNEASENEDVDARLRRKIIQGSTAHLADDLAEALPLYPTPLDIIAGPLMAGMDEVGRLFGEGKLFLPQVVKTARAMKHAVDILQPHIERSQGGASALGAAGKVLIATVKGDVHDIGKNIVAVILRCNNYEVVDLGVMVPPEAIVAAAQREHPDVICLSALITPSLQYMRLTLQALRDAGITTPVMVGGATTSARHTALKLAPEYGGPVIHVSDASQNPVTAARLLSPAREAYLRTLADEQRRLRQPVDTATAPLPKPEIDWGTYTPPTPPHLGTAEPLFFPVAELRPLIDPVYLLHSWRLTPGTPVADEQLRDADMLLDELCTLPDIGALALTAFYRARATEGGIYLPDEDVTIATAARRGLSLADFVAPTDDCIGVFATTVSEAYLRLQEAATEDEYRKLLLATLADRLAEAAAERLSQQLAETGWHGIRPAVGYPCFPGQHNIFTLDRLLTLQRIGITLTESGAMSPPSSTAGLLIPHPEARYF